MTAASVPATAGGVGSPVARMRRWIDATAPVDLTLRFSVVAVIAASHYEPLLMVVAAVAAVPLLTRRSLLHHPAPWLIAGAALAAWQVPQWYRFDNHVWLTTYWVLAIGLALTTPDPERTLTVSGRLMVGLIFALAAAWKVGSADFRSGDFFHYTLLRDDRFGFVADHLGGIDAATRRADGAAVRGLAERPEQWVHLQSSVAVRRLAALFTMWGALVEVTIALVWLLPLRRWTWLRPAALLAFVATTYLVVPIGAFGCLLMAMGLSQTTGPGRQRTAYCLAFALLLWYGPVWQTAFAR